MDDYREIKRYLERQKAWEELKTFVQWLKNKGIYLAVNAPQTVGTGISLTRPLVKYDGHINDLLADYDGFDMEQIEHQKELIVRNYLNDLNLDD